MASSLNCYLMVMNGPEDGRIVELNKDRITIGRGDDNDVVLRDDFRMKPSHALLMQRDSEFLLVSESPTERQVTNSATVIPGQIFVLGETEFIIKSR